MDSCIESEEALLSASRDGSPFDPARHRSDSDASLSTAEFADQSERPSDDETVHTVLTAGRKGQQPGQLHHASDAVVFRFPFVLKDLALNEKHGRMLSSVSASHPDGQLISSSASRKDLSGLCKMHACIHCHASKTACTDVRPCPRCIRLGLECSSEREQPRKRACKGCHAGKVACESTAGAEVCNRCQRLGIACVPRSSPAATSGGRKRRRNPMKPGDGLVSSGDFEVLEVSPRVRPAPGELRDMALNVAASLLQLSQGEEQPSALKGEELPSVHQLSPAREEAGVPQVPKGEEETSAHHAEAGTPQEEHAVEEPTAPRQPQENEEASVLPVGGRGEEASVLGLREGEEEEAGAQLDCDSDAAGLLQLSGAEERAGYERVGSLQTPHGEEKPADFSPPTPPPTHPTAHTERALSPHKEAVAPLAAPCLTRSACDEVLKDRAD